MVNDAGGRYVSSCIFGTPPVAKARQLVVAVAGDQKDKEKVKPILDYIGRYTIDAGEENEKCKRTRRTTISLTISSRYYPETDGQLDYPRNDSVVQRGICTG